MAKTKKEKKKVELVEPEVKDSISDVEPEVVEPVMEPEVETIGAKELKKIYAADKARNPELYVLKNKDAELERKLKLLK